MEDRWTTKNEMSFIDHLGTHAPLRLALTPASKLAVLTGYADGIQLRRDWGEMDAHKVANYVNYKIAALKAAFRKELK
jgi:hypothetical protein